MTAAYFLLFIIIMFAFIGLVCPEDKRQNDQNDK